MNIKKETNYKKAGASLATIIGVFIITIFLTTGIVPTPRIEPTDDGKSWHIIWEGNLASATEASLGATAGGFLEIYFVNHSATGNTTYSFNTTTIYEGWADAHLLPSGVTGHAHSYNDSFKLQLKHSTLFDIVIKCRFNKTQCWNGSAFILSDTRVNITCAGFATMADIKGVSIATHNHTSDDFLWTTTYWQDADGITGSGFTLSKGAVAASNTISIKIAAKY